MKKLVTGEYYGSHYQKTNFENLIITDTKYIHKKVNWHYHENPYFTYLLQGKLFESNKKEAYYLEPGSLLFHNWQDAHYNIKPSEFTRGFHVELNANWFLNYDIKISEFEGSLHLTHPCIKHTMNQIFTESKINDQFSQLSVDIALLNIFSNIKRDNTLQINKPFWLKALKEFLMEEPINSSLRDISSKLNVHPVHLSREFSRYFGITLGTYLRLLKINKAFHLMISGQLSLTEISYQCGFFDQSHFIKTFKKVHKTTPLSLLKKML